MADVGVTGAGWAGRRVLVTGHTGFKGAWLTLWLHRLGASVHGLSTPPPTDPSLFALARVDEVCTSHAADVRDLGAVVAAVEAARPDVVFHLAAQPLVRRSLREPRETYEVNVMGTVNLLEALRQAGRDCAVVVVTSDKCYENQESETPYREDEPLGGHDPYSSSKACQELVAASFRATFFGAEDSPRVATARAGNVIGGGDWGEDRLVPDLMRGALAGRPIEIRRPDAVRPWQHVLNPLSGYLALADALLADRRHATAYNFGPADEDARPVAWVAERLAARWPGGLEVRTDPGPHPHETTLLRLDSAKARRELAWRPGWDLPRGLDETVSWYAALTAGDDVRATTLGQIDAFAATFPSR